MTSRSCSPIWPPRSSTSTAPSPASAIPPLDVRETDERASKSSSTSPACRREALRVLFREGVLLVAGEKAPPPATEEQTYHLVEREFGRFARAVRVNGAFDVAAGHGDGRAMAR